MNKCSTRRILYNFSLQKYLICFRVYSTVIGNGRTLQNNTTICGYRVPKGVSTGLQYIYRYIFYLFICFNFTICPVGHLVKCFNLFD